MKTYHFPDKDLLAVILQRPVSDISRLQDVVQDIFSQVRDEGDKALKELTLKYDNTLPETVCVPQTEIEQSAQHISRELKQAIEIAAANIEKFHRAQFKKEAAVETMEGVVCWRENRPVERVGFYIPGGSAPLFSTVLMLGIPAAIAGCKEIILCSPPGTNAKVHPAILYCAQRCGINKIYAVGGAQAIAAMTFGTSTIPAVYKIFGPGNAYVMAAKQLAQRYGVAIDMPAGPSEVMVIADQSANASFVAADLLSQAEHGPDSQVILVTNHALLIENVIRELQHQLAVLPRSDVAARALENSKAISVRSIDEAIQIANIYAPEHLIISTADAEKHLGKITNAGSVFLGNFTPESCGDYASGTNHTLPTNGYARSYSGVSVDAFLKKMTVQKLSKQGLANLAHTVTTMAMNEGLHAHAHAVNIRLQDD